MTVSKKCHWFVQSFVVRCLLPAFLSFSFPSYAAKAQEVPSFFIIFDPLSHGLEKVYSKPVTLDLKFNILAEETSLSELEAEDILIPEPKEILFPWNKFQDLWTTPVRSALEGCSVPNPSNATWFDRLTQNAKKYKKVK